VGVHLGLAQNEPDTQEEFNSIGSAADFTVEPVILVYKNESRRH